MPEGAAVGEFDLIPAVLLLIRVIHNSLANIPIGLVLPMQAVTVFITTFNHIFPYIFGAELPKQCAAKYNKLYKVACLDVLRCRLHY